MPRNRYAKLLAGIDPDAKPKTDRQLNDEYWAKVYWNRYALKDHWYDHSKDFDYLHDLCEKAHLGQYTEAKGRPRDTTTLATATREQLQDAQHRIVVRRGQKWVK